MTQPYAWETHRREESIHYLKQTSKQHGPGYTDEVQKERGNIISSSSLVSRYPVPSHAMVKEWEVKRFYAQWKLMWQTCKLSPPKKGWFWGCSWPYEIQPTASFLFPELRPWKYPDFYWKKIPQPISKGISGVASKCIMLCAMSKSHRHRRVDEWPTSDPVWCYYLAISCLTSSRTSLKEDCCPFIQGSHFLFRTQRQRQVSVMLKELMFQGSSFAQVPLRSRGGAIFHAHTL